VLEALSREFRDNLPMKLLYADDLVFKAEKEELLVSCWWRRFRIWKKSMEKVMKRKARVRPTET